MNQDKFHYNAQVEHDLSSRSKIIVRVPGSSANLGPGFDTVAIALSVYVILTAELLPADDPNIPLIQLNDSISQQLPAGKTNLVYKIFCDVWHDDLALLRRLRIKIDSQIPIGKGLGSSGAAVIAALIAAYKLVDKPINIDEIVMRAKNYEGHAENVCASLFGGLVICAPSSDGDRIITRQVNWPQRWKTILTVPARPLPTKKSRAVIPLYVQHKDAIHNIQRVAMFLKAVADADAELMKEALHDKLHQPYRAHLVPELAEIPHVLQSVNTIGTILSGAGSSVLTIVDAQYHQKAIEILSDWASRQQNVPIILDLRVDEPGFQEM